MQNDINLSHIRCSNKECRSRRITVLCSLEFTGQLFNGEITFSTLPDISDYKLTKFLCSNCGREIKVRCAST